MLCLRFFCGHAWVDYETSVSVRERCHLPAISRDIGYRRLSWLEHVPHMSEDQLPLKVLFSLLPGPDVIGRLRDSWQRIAQSGLTELYITPDGSI